MLTRLLGSSNYMLLEQNFLSNKYINKIFFCTYQHYFGFRIDRRQKLAQVFSIYPSAIFLFHTYKQALPDFPMQLDLNDVIRDLKHSISKAEVPGLLQKDFMSYFSFISWRTSTRSRFPWKNNGMTTFH